MQPDSVGKSKRNSERVVKTLRKEVKNFVAGNLDVKDRNNLWEM